MYCEPIQKIIGTSSHNIIGQTQLLSVTQNSTMVHLSIKNSLISVFSMKNLFDATETYMKTLYSQKGVIENFIQCTV